MSDPPLPLMPPKSRRKRWLVVGGLLVVALVGLPLGGYLFLSWYMNRELAAAIAEARAVEPLLTIDELEAGREVVSAEENSAPRIIEASQHIPENLPFDKQVERVRKLAPLEPLDQEAQTALQATLAQTEPALERLRGFEELRRGRHAIQWLPDVVSTRMDHAMKSRRVNFLLICLATERAEAGQADEALLACRAALNVGRSLADEPSLIAQLVRVACLGQVFDALERLLARSEPSAAALLAMQQALEEEDRVPIMFIALRGERAANHAICEAVASGELPLAGLLDGLKARPSSIEDHAEEIIGRQLIIRCRPYCLRYFTGLLPISLLPLHERKPAIAALLVELGDPPLLSPLLTVAIEKGINAFLRHHAKIRVAIAALAVERYRLRHGQWPDSLNDLAPDFLKEVPLDPYDGQPLRYRRTDDGVLIYSIGPDEGDDGGTIDRQANLNQTKGLDLGFQLWDPQERRKATGKKED